MQKKHLHITLAVVIIITASVILLTKFSNASPNKNKENFIYTPKDKQIFQQKKGVAKVSLVIRKDKADCSIDKEKIKDINNINIKVGKHTIYCKTENAYDSAEFFVGDIFVIAGQSNAFGAAKDYKNTPKANSNTVWYDQFKKIYRNPGIDKENLDRKVEIGGNAWTAFANRYYEKTKTPVGIINLTYINTIDEYLSSRELPNKNFFYPFFLDEIEKNKEIKGIIWYHGESAVIDDQTSKAYGNKLSKFISNVREDLKYPDLPFYIINIARYKPVGYDKKLEKYWQQVRNSIKAVAKNNHNVFIVAQAEDLPLNCDIIPGNNDCMHLSQTGQNTLGERVAQALTKL